MPGIVVGAFFLECSAQSHQLCSVESPSNGLVRFEQLIIHDTKLIPSNTQVWVFFHEYSAWLSMLKHDQMVSMISSSLGYRNGSIFHQWYDAKNPFVYAWQAALWKIGVQRFSASVHMEPNSLVFESFPMIKRYEIVCWVTPNVSASSFCVWHESSSNNVSNSVFVHFRPSATFFIFDIKFTILKLLKRLTTTSLT